MTTKAKTATSDASVEDVIEGKKTVTREEIEGKGEIYAEITGKTDKKLLTTPPFFPFVNRESGETRLFRGKFVGVYENKQLKNPLIFKDEDGNTWLFPANYIIKQTLDSLSANDQMFTTTLEIEFIETKKTTGGNHVNIFRIYAC